MNRVLIPSLSVLALPGVIAVAYLLDSWILIRTANPFDGTHAWARSVSLLSISILLLALAWFILTHGRTNRLVAALYLLAGLILTLLQPLAVTAYVTKSSALQSFLALTGPLLQFLLACGSVSQFTFAFVAAIGVGSLFPRRIFAGSENTPATS